MQKRIQSPILWLACAALFSFVMKNWVGWEIPKFDEFVEQWKSQGGDTITAEVNEWVQAHK